MSPKRTNITTSMSRDEYLAHIQGRAGRTSKYHNHKVEGYDSGREWARAKKLQDLERDGAISELREQVRYELIPAQYVDGKRIEEPCSYVADFVYRLPDGTEVVEDVKGYRTKEYIIKRKLMLYLNDIHITEV